MLLIFRTDFSKLGVYSKSVTKTLYGTFLVSDGISKADTYGTETFVCLVRCPPWRGLNWKVPKFKVRLFYTGLTLRRTPPPLYLTMGIWNGEKEAFFFNVSVYLTSKVKVVTYFLLLSISDHNVLQLFSYHFQRSIYFAILILPGKTRYSTD